MSSRYWAAATVSVAVGLPAELLVLAVALRLDDRDYGRLPLFALVVSAIVAVGTASARWAESGPVLRGARRGMFTTAVLLAVGGVLSAWLYGGFWQ